MNRQSHSISGFSSAASKSQASLLVTRDFPWLYRFSLFVTTMTLLLILAGGLVTSHDAGLAVPDWPTSYGQWFPPMVGNVFWEHGHRMIAGTVLILSLTLAVMVQKFEERVWLKKLMWTAFGAVIAQALLGGLTVLLMLPPAVSIIHATLAQTFFCLMVAMTYFLSPYASGGRASSKSWFDLQENKSSAKRLRRLLIMTTIFIYTQLILGAAIRHSNQTVAFHVIVAFLVAVHVMLVVTRVFRFHFDDALLSKASLGLGLLVIVQFFLGMGAFIFTRMVTPGYAPSSAEVLVTTAHQTLAAVILATSFLMTLRSRQ